jgi:hypothetical protein
VANLTGVTFIGPEYGKRLELLREVAPKLARVALLYNDKNPASVLAMKGCLHSGAPPDRAATGLPRASPYPLQFLISFGCCSEAFPLDILYLNGYSA